MKCHLYAGSSQFLNPGVIWRSRLLGTFVPKNRTMFQKSILVLILLASGLASCNKKQDATPRSAVFVRYVGEEQELVIEEVQGQWNNSNISLVADGYDHEQLKIYLPNITHLGDVKNLSEQNISFTDGLDFSSTKMTEGIMTITDMDEEKVCGTFTVSLIDDVGGVEAKGIAGEFIVRKN